MPGRPLPFLLLLAAAPCLSQGNRAPQPENFGTAIGHVICSDTQHPARLAEVCLVPINSESETPAPPANTFG